MPCACGAKRHLKSLLVPGGILLLAVAVLVYSGWLTLALPALSFLYYCALIGGMLLAWRFHSSRIFFALVVLFLAQQAIALSGAGASARNARVDRLAGRGGAGAAEFRPDRADARARFHRRFDCARRPVSVRAVGDRGRALPRC